MAGHYPSNARHKKFNPDTNPLRLSHMRPRQADRHRDGSNSVIELWSLPYGLYDAFFGFEWRYRIHTRVFAVISGRAEVLYEKESCGHFGTNSSRLARSVLAAPNRVNIRFFLACLLLWDTTKFY